MHVTFRKHSLIFVGTNLEETQEEEKHICGNHKEKMVNSGIFGGMNITQLVAVGSV